MSHIFELFNRVEKNGIKLELTGDQLKINILHDRDLVPGLLAELKERKAEIIAFLRQAGHYRPVPVQEKREYYPVSSVQRRMVALNQIDPQSVSYNISGIYELEGEVDTERFTQVFRQLIQRHESLRTSFFMKDEEPVQRVYEQVAFELELFRADGQGGQGPERGAAAIPGTGMLNRIAESPQFVKPQAKLSTVLAGSEGDCCESLAPDWQLTIIRGFIRPFDLGRAPLLRVGLIRTDETRHILMFDMHHIVSDGVSTGLLIKDFVYLASGQALPPMTIQYKDFACWQNSPGQRQLLKEQELFWLDKFKGDIPVLELPSDFPRPTSRDFAGDHLFFGLAVDDVRSLREIANQTQTTMTTLLLGIFSIFLSKLSGQEDIVIGTPVAGRQHADLQEVIGMFVNTLALRAFPVGDKRWLDFLTELNRETVRAFQNQDYPFEELVDQVTRERDMSRNPLFDVMFTLQDTDRSTLTIGDLKLSVYPFESDTAKFDLTLTLVERGETISGNFEYSSRLFMRETIERYAGYFTEMVRCIVGGGDIYIKDINMIPQAELTRIKNEFNARQNDYPCDQSIPGLFAGQVQRTPDRVALSGEAVGVNGHSPHHYTLSYSGLDRRSDELAQALIEKGVLPNTIVGIQIERSIEMIIGILAILKAGGAYLPIDPELPPERIDYMLADSGAEVIIGPQGVGANCCSPIQDIGAECRGERQFAPTDLAYVIYTSGSTGRPKGVPISHQNLSPLLHWGYQHLGLGPQERTIQNLSYFFDWSVWEIFLTLTSGASLHLIGREIILSPPAMSEFIDQHAITVLHCTPSQFQYLLNEGRRLDSLRHLCLGAEKLDYDLLKRSLAVVPEECRVYNMYGPTEATIIAAVLEIDRHHYEGYGRLTSVPIGRMAGNTALWVLDRWARLCPVGVAGELYLGGPGLSRGYLNNPELTAERFVGVGARGNVAERGAAAIPGTSMLNRIAESPQFVKPQAKLSTVLAGSEGDWCVSPAPDVSLYKTGDLCRWLADGSIEFLGRLDFQVKIRGYRIELHEIEAQLLKHPAIKEAVVLAREADGSEKYLCAYLVIDPTKPTETKDIRDYLAKKLPAYMIPAQFVCLEQLPLNPNGKVDRKALPEPQINLETASYTAPQDDIEWGLAEIWAEILGLEKGHISTDRNFFEMGGHSLKATRLIARINKHFAVHIPLAEIFKISPTIKEIAAFIRVVRCMRVNEEPGGGTKEEFLI